MKQYVAYIRVSTKRQGEQGASLPEQKRAIEKYAHDNELSIIEWFEEQETAAKRGRPIFSRMLAMLESGEAQGVIIHKIDRSARNLKDWANLGDLIDAGIDVRFAHESIDLSTRGGRLSADIQAVVAADYIRNMRDEIRKGINGRLKDGIYPLPAPLGYLNTGGGKPKIIDPARGPLVRNAFGLYASGLYSMKAMRDEMNRRGLTTRGGKPISIQSLWNMLHNPFYIGLMRLKGRKETYQGKHEPLIEKTVFDRAQLIASGKAAVHATVHDFLFRSLVKCAKCGRSLVGERQKGRYTYYRCHAEGCEGTTVREEALDHVVQSNLALLVCGEAERQWITRMVSALRGKDGEHIAELKAAFTLQVSKYDERLDRLTDAFLDEQIDKETYERRKSAILHEKRSVLDRLDSFSRPDSIADTAFEKLELGNSAYSGYRNGLWLEKRTILEKVCSNFTADGKNLAFALKSPFQQVSEWRNSQNSGAPRKKARTRARELLSIILAADKESGYSPVLLDGSRRAA